MLQNQFKFRKKNSIILIPNKFYKKSPNFMKLGWVTKYCQFNKRISFWLVDWRNTLPCQETHFLMLSIQINLSLKLLTKMADMKICVYAYIHVYIHIICILYAFFDSFFNTIAKRSVIFSIREKIGKMFQIFM